MNKFKLLLLSTLLAVPSIASAADVSAVAPAADSFDVKRVAVVDVKKVMDESVASKDAQGEINTIKDKYYKEIEASDKALQNRRKELAEQKSAMSPEAFGKKVNEFENKVQSERKEAARKQKIVEAAFVKSLELIRDETIKIVNEIAQEKSLDMIVPTSQLLYSKKNIDITDEVISKLNSRLTKVNINIKQDDMPAPAADKSDAKPEKADKADKPAKADKAAKSDAKPAPEAPTTPPASIDKK